MSWECVLRNAKIPTLIRMDWNTSVLEVCVTTFDEEMSVMSHSWLLARSTPRPLKRSRWPSRTLNAPSSWCVHETLYWNFFQNFKLWILLWACRSKNSHMYAQVLAYTCFLSCSGLDFVHIMSLEGFYFCVLWNDYTVTCRGEVSVCDSTQSSLFRGNQCLCRDHSDAAEIRTQNEKDFLVHAASVHHDANCLHGSILWSSTCWLLYESPVLPGARSAQVDKAIQDKRSAIIRAEGEVCQSVPCF